MVCLRNICINTLHKGDNDDDDHNDHNDDNDHDDDDNNNNNNNLCQIFTYYKSVDLLWLVFQFLLLLAHRTWVAGY